MTTPCSRPLTPAPFLEPKETATLVRPRNLNEELSDSQNEIASATHVSTDMSNQHEDGKDTENVNVVNHCKKLSSKEMTMDKTGMSFCALCRSRPPLSPPTPRLVSPSDFRSSGPPFCVMCSSRRINTQVFRDQTGPTIVMCIKKTAELHSLCFLQAIAQAKAECSQGNLQQALETYTAALNTYTLSSGNLIIFFFAY